MIPNIFISSTIADFYHLRDAVRETILEVGYNPIMSDYGDIGYLPSLSAEDSCYKFMKDSQLAIIIIGKRYGYVTNNELSITQNEFRTAKMNKKPVICLIEKDVLTYKTIYDANNKNHKKNKVTNYPGMDNPEKTFRFIDEFMTSTVNNGYYEFITVTDIKSSIKKQFAIIFGELLRNSYDTIKYEIKDILSEVKTLRHELLKNEKSTYEPLLKTFKYLLAEENNDMREFFVRVSDDIDSAVPYIFESNSIADFIKVNNYSYIINNDIDVFRNDEDSLYASSFVTNTEHYERHDNKKLKYCEYVMNNELIVFNDICYEYFNVTFQEMKRKITNKK